MIGVQKCQFLDKSEIEQMYMPVVINDECLVCIHSFDFPLNTHITKTEQLTFDKFDQQQGQFRRSWSYLFCT